MLHLASSQRSSEHRETLVRGAFAAVRAKAGQSVVNAAS